MARDHRQVPSIALLATGDEVSNGDILNLNSREIAQRLTHHGLNVGMHLVTGDVMADMVAAMQFLLQSHQALIITGGLGPTSDDLTRFALSQAIGRKLIFDEASWQGIVNRLHSLGYAAPPETNRQQALFPEGAEIIANPHGTAAGCWLKWQEQWLFMLPGPPTECLPLVDKTVIPLLTSQGFVREGYKKHWYLFGASEGKIAEELDPLSEQYACTIGYRLAYPYVELKIQTTQQESDRQLIPLIEEIIAPYLLNDGQAIASQLLLNKLRSHTSPIAIVDLATGGALEALLNKPQFSQQITFAPRPFPATQDLMTLTIDGLADYWQRKQTSQTTFTIQMVYQDKNDTQQYTIPYREERTILYAVEFICWKVYEYLSRT